MNKPYRAYICITIISSLFIGCEDEPEPVPIAPSNLIATVASSSQIDLVWSDNSTNEETFKIKRKTDATDFQSIATLEKDITGYSDKGLAQNSLYVYRVYAINATGEPSPYSNEVSITTSGIPILSTSAITGVNAFSAVSGGNISIEGGSAITAKGIVWSTNPNPTVALATKTVDTSGSSEFISTITELNWSTAYHVRAYAINSTGTGYGNALMFTTGQLTISTSGITNIEYFSSNTGGSVGADGGYPISERGVVWSEDQNPTTALATKIIDGTGTGDFSSSLLNLSSNRKYFVRSYAISTGGTAYGQQLEFTTEGLEDFDGNTYSVVQIGSQIWMSENLETTSYKDGTAIPEVTENSAWSALTTGGYCWHDNNKGINIGIFGALYNWYAVDTGNLCPTEWHVPSDGDWNILSNYLGGNTVAGGKMKGTGVQFWSPPNTGATNESAFNALPNGVRVAGGDYSIIGFNADWWSSTEKDALTAYPRDLQADNAALNLELNGSPKEFGFAVRCVKD